MGFLRKLFGLKPNIASLKAGGRVDRLIEALAHEDWTLRAAAAQALGELGRSEAIQALEKAYDGVRESEGALREYDDLPLSRSTPSFKKAESETRHLREAIVRALSALRRTQASRGKSLAVAIAQARADTRTAKASETLPTSARIERLLSVITTTEPVDRPLGNDPVERAQKELGSMGAPAVQAIMVEITRQEGYRRADLVAALGLVGDKHAVSAILPALLPFLADPHSAVRSTTAGVLEELKDERSVESLASALLDSDSGCRHAAARALAEFGDARILTAVTNGLSHRDEYVRLWSVKALARLRDPSTIPALHTVVVEDRSREAREAAAAALGAMDATARATAIEARASRAIDVGPGRTALFLAMQASKDIDRENPIELKDTAACIYFKGGSSIADNYWRLEIPTGRRIRKERLVKIDPNREPDSTVAAHLCMAPSWNLGPGQEHSLTELLRADYAASLFDFHNPILLADVAYVFHDKDDGWRLRIASSRDAERDFPLRQLGPFDDAIGKRVMDAVASAGFFGP